MLNNGIIRGVFRPIAMVSFACTHIDRSLLKNYLMNYSFCGQQKKRIVRLRIVKWMMAKNIRHHPQLLLVFVFFFRFFFHGITLSQWGQCMNILIKIRTVGCLEWRRWLLLTTMYLIIIIMIISLNLLSSQELKTSPIHSTRVHS